MSFIKNFINIPPKKKYLIINESGSEILFKDNLISKKSALIIDFRTNKYLNIWAIIIGLIYNLKIFKKSKYAWVIASYARLVSPTYVITFMDYIIHFYYAKQY